MGSGISWKGLQPNLLQPRSDLFAAVPRCVEHLQPQTDQGIHQGDGVLSRYSKISKIDFLYVRLGIGSPSRTSSTLPYYLSFALDRQSGKVFGFILTCDIPVQRHGLILYCRMRENVASHSPWRLSFDGCAPWFPGVARIHTSDTHTIRFHRWNLNEADEAFLDFIIDLPLKYLRKIIEWGGFQPSIANTCFQERLTEYNLLAEYSKQRIGNI